MRKRFIAGLVAALVVGGIVVAKRHELLRFAFCTAASLASGYSVRYGDQLIGGDHAAFVDVHVSRGGYPVLDARRIDIWYSLRDLLPGSTHRFGLTAIAVDGAKVTIVHFKDGTYNLNIPQGKAAPPEPQLPQPVDPVPIRFGLRMENAQMELVEPYAYDSSAKDVKIHDFNVDATIDTALVTHYDARGAFLERRKNEPFTIAGTIDAVRGYAMHRAQARWFPLRALANYFADTAALRVIAGRARNFDARLYSLDVRPNLPSSYHVNLQLDLDGATMTFVALADPIHDIHGHLYLVDNDVFVRGLQANLSGVPMRMTGGLYDLTGDLTGEPQLRLGIDGTGDLKLLKHAFTFTRTEPIGGIISLGILVEGPLDNPIVIAHGQARSAVYRAMPLRALDAHVVYRDNVVALAPLDASYAGVQIGVHGALDVGGPHVLSKLALHVVASADRLPYLDEMLAGEPMLFDAVSTGDDLRFTAEGAFASSRGVDRAAGLVSLRPDGTGTVEPMWLHTPTATLDGGYILDRPHDDSAFWATASNLNLHVPRYKTFPGVELPVIPPIEGHLESFSVAGGGAGKNVKIAGAVTGGRSSIAGVQFDRIAAAFSGSFTDAAINLLHARGPWGRFDGAGAFSTQGTFVARGAYRGTLDGLQPFLGSSMPGHGPIAGTAAIAVENDRIVVQGDDLRMDGATLHGVPVSRASLTLAVQGDKLDVYSAHARAAGGDVVAAGSFSVAAHPVPGAGPPLSLLANRLDAQQLHGIGLPIDSGRLTASGDLSAGLPLPSYRGGVTVVGGTMLKFPMAGNADVDLAGNAVRLSHTVGALGSTYALVSGDISGLISGSPAYSIDARVPAGDVESAMRTLDLPTYMMQGVFNADLHVGGAGALPVVSGRIGVPGGNVNGLPFVDASGTLAASTTGVSFQGGRAAVGTTDLRFSAIAQPKENAIRIASDRADLSDFNNFFDTGDTLDGTGPLRFGAVMNGGHIATSGTIDVRGFRYRNLPFGDVRANWSSARNDVTGTLAVGGPEGTLNAGGAIGLASSPDLRAVVERSRYDLKGSIENLDLSLWVPAFGFHSLPITGRASGDAQLHGRYPQLAMTGKASIDGGALGPLTLDTAKIAFHSKGSRIAIDSSELETPGLSASATGSIGLLPADPIDLSVHAQTDDIARLTYELRRVRVPVTGSFESTLAIGGTFKSPSFAAGFDATDVQAYGISVASAFGEVKLRGDRLILSDAGANFATGEATLAGELPLQLSPFRLGPPAQAVSFDLDVINLDPGVFDAVLGANTKMGGKINGHVGLAGTVGAPQIIGRATLTDGSYVSDIERTPIAQTVATLTFNRSSAAIESFSAKFGSGTVTGKGTVTFPDGFDSSSNLAYDIAIDAAGAQLSLPAYGTGTLDAKLALKKNPGRTAELSGKVALSNATLPFATFVQIAQQSSAAGSAAPPIPIAFDLEAVAGKNVRVRGNGYGAGLDIGATGAVKLGGTLEKPTLDGAFNSTGGTLTYFDRAFKVQKAAVRFNPADGVLPTIAATATAHVPNPDPDHARNPYGAADVTINVSGQIAGLKVGLTSNPPGYTQDQLIALIAPFGGFFNGIAFNNTSALQVQSPSGITPLGALQPIPGNLSVTRSSGTVTVGQEAFNILNAQFAAGLLAPVENALGQGLGLSSVNLTLGYYGNVGFTATRELSAGISAVYAVTFGIPQVQSFGLQVAPSRDTTATLSLFTQSGTSRLFTTPGGLATNQNTVLGQPLQGDNGFSFAFQRYF